MEELKRAWDAGDAVLPVDLRLAAPARRRLLESLRPAVLVTGAGTGRLGAKAPPAGRGAQVLADPLPVEDGDALVMATSGTTGEPKGVVLTHAAVAASARATSSRLGVDSGTDTWWACLPLSHVGGLSVVTRSLLEGVPCEVVEGFSVEGAAAALDRGATLTSLVPTTLRRLGDRLAGGFRRIVLGGTAPPGGLAPNVVTTYGMTETGSGVVYDGLPLDGVEVRVDGGEVQLRGPMLLRAYRDGLDPKDAAGWLPTGDAGEIAADGRLVVFGRLGELIITGGENVWPSAVEELLRRHDQVADAAVAGVPDPEWGERVVAYVVLSAAAGPAGTDGPAGRRGSPRGAPGAGEQRAGGLRRPAGAGGRGGDPPDGARQGQAQRARLTGGSPFDEGSFPVTARRTARLGTGAVLAAVVLGGCGGSGHAGGSTSRPGSSTTTSASTVVTTTSAPTTTTTVAPTTTTVPSRWSERRLLAQLIMVGGLYSDLPASTAAAEEGAGGLVFLGQPPAGSATALAAGVSGLQRAASVPVFMATDEEGGGIARLSNLVGPLPWPRQMVSEWTPAEVTAHLTAVASAMRRLGMTMDLAPVLDTASSTDTIDEENLRSFSEAASTAATYGLAFMKGLSAGGIISVVKHFPGLGHANGDTDLGPAEDPPLADLVGHDLVPFQGAITAGVRVVMMSNVTEPDWGRAPASVNPGAYRYLRGMGFSGVVLTDSLDAGAISATGLDGAEAVVKAIEAGADMAMVTTASDFPAALAGLEAAVSSGALSMAQVVKSVDRIVAVKDSMLPAGDAVAPPR